MNLTSVQRAWVPGGRPGAGKNDPGGPGACQRGRGGNPSQASQEGSELGAHAPLEAQRLLPGDLRSRWLLTDGGRLPRAGRSTMPRLCLPGPPSCGSYTS